VCEGTGVEADYSVTPVTKTIAASLLKRLTSCLSVVQYSVQHIFHMVTTYYKIIYIFLICYS